MRCDSARGSRRQRRKLLQHHPLAQPAAGQPQRRPQRPRRRIEQQDRRRQQQVAGEQRQAGDAQDQAGGEPEAGEPEADEAEDELTVALRERQEYLALAQRTQADFENYRRRMARETAQAMDRGAGKLAKELLPALDHLTIALQAADEHASGDEWVKGFRLVQDELAAALKRVGIEAYAPLGQVFDPNEHEAMAQAPMDGFESGTVAQVYQSGYRLNGTVLRPARVIVAQ